MNIKLLIKILILTFLFLSLITYSEGLALVEDYQGRLYLFNKGNFTQLEFSKVKQKFIGENYVAYVDYLDNLKVWYNGKLSTIDIGLSNIKSTENLLSWINHGQLNVWDHGITKTLGNNVNKFFIKGDVICFTDNYDNTTKVYFNNQTYSLITNYYSIQTNALSIGRGTVALIDGDSNLITFIRGIINIENMADDNILFLAGLNGIVIKKEYEDELFYKLKNSSYELSNNITKWFDIEYNWILWQDETESVYVLSDYNKKLLSDTKPSLINISPKSIIFEQNNQLNILYNNKISQVSYYIPNEIKHFNDKVVFRNNIGQIEYYEGGENKIISTAPNSKFQMFYNVIIISEGTQRFVYYKNTKYEL